LLTLFDEGLLIRYFESELYLYSIQAIEEEERNNDNDTLVEKSSLSCLLSLQNQLNYLCEKIVTIPSFIQLHHCHTSYHLEQQSLSSLKADFDQSDSLILIFEITSLDSDDKIGKEEGLFEIRKSFFGKINKDFTQSNHMIAEIKKLPFLYFLPDWKHYISPVNDLCLSCLTFKNFMLYSNREQENSFDSANNHYYGCHMIIRNKEDDDNSSLILNLDELEFPDDTIQYVSYVENINKNVVKETNLVESHTPFRQQNASISSSFFQSNEKTTAQSLFDPKETKSSHIRTTSSELFSLAHGFYETTKNQVNKLSQYSMTKGKMIHGIDRSGSTEEWNIIKRSFGCGSQDSGVIPDAALSPNLHEEMLLSPVSDTGTGSEHMVDKDFLFSILQKHKQESSSHSPAARKEKEDEQGESPNSDKSPSFIVVTVLTDEPCFSSLRSHLADSFLKEKKENASKLSLSPEHIVNALNFHLPENPLKTTEFHFDLIPDLLSYRSILTLYFAVLLECKIAIIIDDSPYLERNDISNLIILFEWIHSVIFPLKWQYLCSSLLPLPALEEILSCPTPYMVGMTKDSFRSLMKDSLILVSPVIDVSGYSNQQTHNIQNLVIFNLGKDEIVFPEESLSTNEILFLKKNLCIQQTTQFMNYPLFDELRKLYFPTFQFSYCAELGLINEKRKQLISVCLQTTSSSLPTTVPSSLTCNAPSFNNDSVAEKVTQVFQLFTHRLLCGVNYCCLPVFHRSKVSLLNNSFPEILFDEKIFHMLKTQEISISTFPVLFIPSFDEFLHTFVHCQAFSMFVSSCSDS
jgi:hypothetical protein